MEISFYPTKLNEESRISRRKKSPGVAKIDAVEPTKEMWTEPKKDLSKMVTLTTTCRT
jgi:hypothetical protein